MPRSASLKPTEIKSRKEQGLHAWCLNVPIELSPEGKRQRLFFATKSEATVACEKLKARRDNYGVSLTGAMSQGRMSAAIEAYNLLDPLKIDLMDAVRAHIQLVSERTASVPFGAVFDRFAELKQDKSTKYCQEIRQAKATFSPLLERQICDIRAVDLEPILDRLPASSRNAKMGLLRTVFNLAVKREWMPAGASPIAHMDFTNRPAGEVETIPNELVQAMLEHALKNDLGLAPFLTLGFFCGIRPRGELEKLKWSDVDLPDRTATIRPEVSKTARKRFVDLSENAVSWIEAYRQRGGVMEGRIVPYTAAVLRKRRRLNWKAVGNGKTWVQQGMRHTFCSNWLAKHGDINKLVMQSGHQSVDVMFRCYHKGVKKEQAERFWAIRPVDACANVVAFQKIA